MIHSKRILYSHRCYRNLQEEQNLTMGYSSRCLVVMNASLSNALKVLFKQTVRYVCWCFETHTKLNVAAPASATYVVHKFKMTKIPVQYVGKTTSNCFQTRVWNVPSTNFKCFVHTKILAASGAVSLESWNITWRKSFILVRLGSLVIWDPVIVWWFATAFCTMGM